MNATMSTLENDWDAIIVGTGPGGASTGYVLAQAGWRVLFIEQGRSYLTNPDAVRGGYAEAFFAEPGVPAERHRTILENAGRWSEFLNDHSSSKPTRHIPFIGPGAEAPVHSMAPPWNASFRRIFDQAPIFRIPTVPPSLRHGRSSMKTWSPITGRPNAYTASAAGSIRCGPLRIATTCCPPPTCAPPMKRLASHLRTKGLHPYRLPLACDLIPGCQTCQGFLCPNQCKHDSVQVCCSGAGTACCQPDRPLPRGRAGGNRPAGDVGRL